MADNVLKTDEEKAEELKAWWKANGISVIAGIALAIAAMFGWQQWQQNKLDKAEGASKLFSQLSKKPEDKTLLEKLNSEYGDTPYAALANLSVAKAACNQNKIKNCISQLKAAINNSPEPNVALIAKVRLARTLISAGQLDEASKIISSINATAFTSLTAELNGDLFLAKKDYQKAREAYDKAIQSSAGQNMQLLKMKRDDLGDGS